MNKLLAGALSVLAVTISGVGAHAQEPEQSLNLFQQVERQQAVSSDQPAGPRSVDPRANAPQFTLVGTSRFGDQQRARLRSQSGEVIVVTIDPSGNVPIPGYPGYQITDGGSRQLIVQHPANTPCFEATDQGVSCSAPNVARLQLATAKPIQPAPEPARGNGRRNDRGVVEADPASVTSSTDAGAPTENPFAAALRAARERGEADPAVIRAEAERFRPRRVDPSEVPEGARVVRTPFGDRIIMPEENSQITGEAVPATPLDGRRVRGQN